MGISAQAPDMPLQIVAPTMVSETLDPIKDVVVTPTAGPSPDVLDKAYQTLTRFKSVLPKPTRQASLSSLDTTSPVVRSKPSNWFSRSLSAPVNLSAPDASSNSPSAPAGHIIAVGMTRSLVSQWEARIHTLQATEKVEKEQHSLRASLKARWVRNDLGQYLRQPACQSESAPASMVSTEVVIPDAPTACPLSCHAHQPTASNKFTSTVDEQSIGFSHSYAFFREHSSPQRTD